MRRTNGTITYTRARQLAWIRTDGHVVSPATSKVAVDRCGTAAGVDPRRWPQAFVMVAVGRARTASARLPPQRSFGVVPRLPIEGSLAMASAVRERWPPVGATPQSLPQGPGHCVGPSSRAGRRSARRRSPSPNRAHGAAALRTQPRMKPHATPRRPAHLPSPARRSQR